MREYALITLNMIEYVCMYLKKQSDEYLNIQKCFRAGDEGGRGGLWNQGNSITFWSQEKMVAQGNILEIFLLDNLKTLFLTENLTQRWAQSGTSFPKSEHFFRFSKRAGETFPFPLVALLVSAAEYASIPLNMPKYPWKYLNKLFWLFQGSQYA